MLVSLNWLKEYVDIEGIGTAELNERMTMSGTKVEAVEELGKDISKVVVGKILSIESHPNADKLVVTKVDVGSEVLQIVTGAKNIRVGDYIPVALVGARLKDIKIRKSKLRGIESHGMMCSCEELGMNTSLMKKEDLGGIYILKSPFKLGEDIKPILGLDDTVVEFELTANRPDCLSIVGIAREVSATFDRHLIQPIIDVKESGDNIEDYLKVSIEDEQSCQRYVARMIKVSKIEPSPYWMQRRLLNCGIRPINNIVDVTNYVMLEMGQPLHAFDYEKLGSNELSVRLAKSGEKITTLDGVDRDLDEEMIIITNGKKPVAIAGVMGGENSDIWDDTKLVVIESANFNKKRIRQTGRKLGLRSEAANRFEKGVDPEIAAAAADRAAQLLVEIGAGQVFSGRIDMYPRKVQEKVLQVNGDWINEFIGIDITVDEMKEYLERLGLNVNTRDKDLTITVPTYRQDLEIKEDIAEEIARLYGYNNIPNTIMSGVVTKGGLTRAQKLEKRIKTLLTSKGFFEILTTSFTGRTQLLGLNLQDGDELFEGVKLLNPLGEENSIMRTTLLPGVLQVISHNYNRNIQEALFYEMAVVYKKVSNLEENLPVEQKSLCLGMYGDKDFFKLKGYVELILQMLRIDSVEYKRSMHPSFHTGRSADIVIGDTIVGTMGEIHPNVVDSYDLPARTYACELNIDKLVVLARDSIRYKELPKFPAVTRDIALLVDEKVAAKEIEDIIKEEGRELLEELKLFDVYQGEQVPEGSKSMAYSLVFRSNERTLVDDEINEIFNSIISQAEIKLGAKLRD